MHRTDSAQEPAIASARLSVKQYWGGITLFLLAIGALMLFLFAGLAGPTGFLTLHQAGPTISRPVNLSVAGEERLDISAITDQPYTSLAVTGEATGPAMIMLEVDGRSYLVWSSTKGRDRLTGLVTLAGINKTGETNASEFVSPNVSITLPTNRTDRNLTAHKSSVPRAENVSLESNASAKDALNDSIITHQSHDEQQVLQETITNTQTIMKRKKRFTGACIETCTLQQVKGGTLVITGDDLVLDQLTLTLVPAPVVNNSINPYENLSRDVVVQTHEIPNQELLVGKTSILDLHRFFSGKDLYFDVPAVSGLDAHIKGASLLLTANRSGNFSFFVYVVSDDVLKSNHFTVVVNNKTGHGQLPVMNGSVSDRLARAPAVRSQLAKQGKVRLLVRDTKQLAATDHRIVKQRGDGYVGLEVSAAELDDMLLSGELNDSSLTVDYGFSPLLLDTMNVTGITFTKENLSLSGAGVKVCLIDTGADASRVGAPITGFDVVGNDTDISSLYAHGTWMARIIHDAAPDAQLYMAKVFDDTGIAYASDVLAGLDWCAAQDPAIISMSIGGGLFNGTCVQDPVAQKVTQLFNAGIVVVASSGNDGSVTAMSSPACAEKVIPVGAFNASFEMASFTNHNANLALLAPDRMSVTDADGTTKEISGTSLSAALVSAGSALVLENDSWSPADLYAGLITSGDAYTWFDDSLGIIDHYDRVRFDAFLLGSGNNSMLNTSLPDVNGSAGNFTPKSCYYGTDCSYNEACIDGYCDLESYCYSANDMISYCAPYTDPDPYNHDGVCSEDYDIGDGYCDVDEVAENYWGDLMKDCYDAEMDTGYSYIYPCDNSILSSYDYVPVGVCAYTSGTESTSTWTCDQDEVAFDGTRYRADCYYAYNGGSTQKLCDNSVSDAGFTAVGVCVYATTTSSSIANEMCDSDEVAWDGARFRADCSYAYTGGSTYRPCDNDVDGTNGYVANGVCAADTDWCDTDNVCYDGSQYNGIMTDCSNMDACDKDIVNGVYSADGIVCGSNCVGSSSSNCCVTADCAVYGGSYVCNPTTYTCEPGCVGEGQSGCTTTGAGTGTSCCYAYDACIEGTCHSSCGSYGGAACSDDSTNAYTSDGACASDGTCDEDAMYYDDESGTYYTAWNSATSYDYDTDTSGDSCDSDATGGYSRNGMWVYSGGTYDSGHCDAFGGVVRIDASNGNRFVANCDSYSGDRCDAATANSNDPFSPDGICGEGCQTGVAYRSPSGAYYLDWGGFLEYDYDNANTGAACDNDVTSAGFSYAGMLVYSGGDYDAGHCDAAGGTVRIDASSGNDFIAGCDSSLDLCDTSTDADATPYASTGRCVSGSCATSGAVCYDGNYVALSSCPDLTLCDKSRTGTNAYAADGITCGGSSCVGSASSNCCTNSDCASSQYCSTSTYTCTSLPTCAKQSGSNSYTYQTSSQDLWNDCSSTSYCSNQYTIYSRNGLCSGSGYSCQSSSSTVTTGDVCDGGASVNPSTSSTCGSGDSQNCYCQLAIDCNDNACSATKYAEGFSGSSCTTTGRVSYGTWYASSGYSISGSVDGAGTTCSQNSDYCSSTDHCSGETWYTGYTCNGAGSCSNGYGAQNKDSSSTYCTSTAPGCTARIWTSSLGYSTSSTYDYCCGDDGSNDDWSTYDNSPTTSTTVVCDSCFNGIDQGQATLHGNGYTTGSVTSSTSLTCYYGDITCSSYARSSGSSATLFGNGHLGGSGTSRTCYYGDITCGDGSASHGTTATVLGWGWNDASPGITSDTSFSCRSGAATCSDGSYADASATTLYGNGYYAGSLTTSTSLTCYYGDPTCADGSESNGAAATYYGNGYVSGSTCYYGDISCADGSGSSGSTCTLGTNDICGDATACFDCTTLGYVRQSTSACYSSCTDGNDAPCASGYTCEGTSCALKLDNGNGCNEDTDCTSGNCRKEIDSGNYYCAAAGKACSENSAAHAGYAAGDLGTNGDSNWLCESQDASAQCASDTQCDEYNGYYCDGAGTWTVGSSNGVDAACGTCSVCGGTSSTNEGDLSCSSYITKYSTDAGECSGSTGCSGSECVCDGAGSCELNNGQSCTLDSSCASGYCDNDGVGLADDGWCYSPTSGYFDSQDSDCEYDTGSGSASCDERTPSTDWVSSGTCNYCGGTCGYTGDSTLSGSYTSANCDASSLTGTADYCLIDADNICLYNTGDDCSSAGWSFSSVACPDYCIDDNNGGACAKTVHAVTTSETCYYNDACSSSGCSLGSTGTLSVNECDVCTASGVTQGESCPASGSTSGNTCYYGTQSCSGTTCDLTQDTTMYSSVAWTSCDYASQTGNDDYCYDVSANYCYYQSGDSCDATNGWGSAGAADFSRSTCYQPGSVAGGACYYDAGATVDISDSCSATGCTGIASQASSSIATCATGAWTDGAMGCGEADYAGNNDRCYYASTDACASDTDGWDYAIDTNLPSGDAVTGLVAGYQYNEATDVCSNGIACSSTGFTDTEYDCDGSDVTTTGTSTLTESEVLSSSCTAVCSGSSCCDVQTITCNAGNECADASSLLSYEDEVPNATCQFTNAGAWEWNTGALPVETNCGDGYDNDCDGFIDYADTDCGCLRFRY